MKRLASLLCAALLVACAPADEAAETETEPEAPTIALADVAGTWSVSAYPETGDSAIVTYELYATDSMDGWTLTFPDRDPIPVRVLPVEGDSIVSDVGPYASALRDGVMVSTHSVMRLQDGRLVGTFVATYETTEADSVLRGRQEGTRSEM